uniref:Uncharacterized protein n=1 Tax=Pygocentrus nattereri TaxID=42514 RepID=A0A3B4D4G1_PYGNA
MCFFYFIVSDHVPHSWYCLNRTFLERVLSRSPCANPGNPVFSCMMRPEATSLSPWVKPQSLLYRTTASEYGLRAPSFESSPCSYHPLSQAFSQHLGQCGMSRDSSFNTSLDHSRVYDCPNLQNTI